MVFSGNHVFDSELKSPAIALLGGTTAQSYHSMGLSTVATQADTFESGAFLDDLSGQAASAKQESIVLIDTLQENSVSAFESISFSDMFNDETESAQALAASSILLKDPVDRGNLTSTAFPIENLEASQVQELQLPGVQEPDKVEADAALPQNQTSMTIGTFSEPNELLGTVLVGESRSIGSLPLPLTEPSLFLLNEEALRQVA